MYCRFQVRLWRFTLCSGKERTHCRCRSMRNMENIRTCGTEHIEGFALAKGSENSTELQRSGFHISLRLAIGVPNLTSFPCTRALGPSRTGTWHDLTEWAFNLQPLRNLGSEFFIILYHNSPRHSQTVF